MNWYKIAQAKRVRAEYWKSVGNWCLIDADKPIDRNLSPLGKPLKLGIGQTVFEFESKEEAEVFAKKKGWDVVE